MAMLEVNDIKVYYGMIQAIKGVSFHVDEGEVIALIGAPDTRSYPWVWRMYRREDEYLHSFPYYRI